MKHTERLRTGLLAALVALAAACGNGADDPGAGSPEGVEQPDIPPVSMVDNDYAPRVLEAPIAREVTIQVRNEGRNQHSFTIDALDVDTGVVEAGETAEATFTIPKEEVQYYCTVHGADVMSGQIIPS